MATVLYRVLTKKNNFYKIKWSTEMVTLKYKISLLVAIILVAFASINLNAQSQTFSPCTPDCEDTWVTPAPKIFNIPGCDVNNTCKITVTWAWRDACGGDYQDIQLLDIEIDAVCFEYCTPKDIYQKALVAAMNQTIFIADWGPKEYPDCDSTWRVANASCWEVVDYSLYDPVTGELIRALYSMRPCNGTSSGCCLQSMSVCRLASGELQISSDAPNNYDFDCSMPGLDPDLFYVFCQVVCDWNLLSGTYSPGDVISSKQTVYKPDLLGLRISIGQELAKISIENNQFHKLKINLVDLSGKLIKDYNITLSVGANHIEIPLSSLETGAYLLLFNFDDKQLKSKQFNIVK